MLFLCDLIDDLKGCGLSSLFLCDHLYDSSSVFLFVYDPVGDSCAICYSFIRLLYNQMDVSRLIYAILITILQSYCKMSYCI